jgi:hypothetical protein
MNSINKYLTKLLFLISLCWLLTSSTNAQNPVYYVDSTCQAFISLEDSLGSPLSNTPPYLFYINGQSFNNSNLATATFDLSNVSDGFYLYYIVDGNQNYISDTLFLNCGNTPNTQPFIQDSLVNVSSCGGLCDGFAFLNIQNVPQQPFTFYINNDTTPFTSTNNSLSFNNLCPGNYYIKAVDSLGNSYATMFEIDCSNSNSLLNCLSNISIDIKQGNAAKEITINPTNLSSSSSFQDINFLLIDGNNQIRNTITYGCDDLGYHQVGVLLQDSFGRWDTCQTLVQVTDSLRKCSGRTYQVIGNTTAAITCDSCTANYFFQGVNITPSNQQAPGPYSYLWSDGDTTINRFDLCPRRNYTLTIFDANGNAYSTTVTPTCPPTTTNCYNPNIIDTSNINCAGIYAPVCGCDQNTYINACEAELKYGITQWTVGSCANNARSIQTVNNSIPSSFGCDTSVFACNGALNINPFGGIAPYTINWAGGRAIGFNPTGLCAGTYSATIIDATGQTYSRSFSVGSNGCTWPGDTDNSAIVNNFDLLPIGLTYGDSGIIRSNQGINWQGYESNDWFIANPTLNLPNYKHIDSDGSGVIDSLDIDAINLNYGQQYTRTSNFSLQGNIPFFVTSGNAMPGDSLTLDVHLGDSRYQVVDAYGVAFTIQYDPAIVDSIQTSINFDNSWLGSDLLSVQKNFSNRGELQIAVTRKDKTPITGWGTLGRLSFTIRDDLIMSRTNNTDTTVTLPLTIGAVRLIDERNQEIGTNRSTGVVTLSPKMNTQEISFLTEGIHVYPNPTTTNLYISSEKFFLEQIQLWNSTGQLVYQKRATNGLNQNITTDQLPQGVYIIKVQTTGGIYTQKVMVLK